jgi:hypothetical protein
VVKPAHWPATPCWIDGIDRELICRYVHIRAVQEVIYEFIAAVVQEIADIGQQKNRADGAAPLDAVPGAAGAQAALDAAPHSCIMKDHFCSFRC